MKSTKIIAVVFIMVSQLLVGTNVFPQVPQSFKYQAVARDASGDPLVNQLVGFRIKIHQGSASGTIVYSETHSLTSNQFGLVNLEIGTGTVVSGIFSAINWQTGSYYVEVELDPAGGTTYQTMGASHLLSVPYALYSEKSGQTFTAGTGINVTGTTITNTLPDQIVSLINGTGITTSGTYPNFTISNASPNAIHTGDATGGTALTVAKIQGNAVSTATPTTNQVLQWNGTQWTPATLTSPSPGWSLTGNSGTSATTSFIGTTDNVPLTFKVNNEKAGKIDNVLNNTSLGILSLNNNPSGGANCAFGCSSLLLNMSGDGNTALGYCSLRNNIIGNLNCAVGTMALWNNSTGNNNCALGKSALESNSSGYSNVAFGPYALAYNSLASNLVAIGDSALFNNGIYATSPFEGSGNTAIGSKALFSNTTGSENLSVGPWSLYSNQTGNCNVALGEGALRQSIGDYNTAVGIKSQCYLQGNFNTTAGYASGWGLNLSSNGSKNSAYGFASLYEVSSGNSNTAIGFSSLKNNTSGNSNVAVGAGALFTNTTTSNLVAIGDSALYNNSGNNNTAIGSKSLYSNTTGILNIAHGNYALYNNTTGIENIAIGVDALKTNNAKSCNIAVGYSAMSWTSDQTVYEATSNVAIGTLALRGGSWVFSDNNGKCNTAIGDQAMLNNTSGSWNTAVGKNSLINNYGGNHMTAFGYNADAATPYQDDGNALGYGAIVNANGKTRIGDVWQNTIEGQVNWSYPSDGRFKTNINEDVKGLEFIKKLRPVTYNFESRKFQEFLIKNFPDSVKQRYRDDKYPDVNPLRQNGFVAQEVEIAAKAVDYNFDGVHSPVDENDNYSISYSQFVVPLVKAVQEQQAMIDKLQLTIEKMQQQIDALKAK